MNVRVRLVKVYVHVAEGNTNNNNDPGNGNGERGSSSNGSGSGEMMADNEIMGDRIDMNELMKDIDENGEGVEENAYENQHDRNSVDDNDDWNDVGKSDIGKCNVGENSVPCESNLGSGVKENSIEGNDLEGYGVEGSDLEGYSVEGSDVEGSDSDESSMSDCNEFTNCKEAINKDITNSISVSYQQPLFKNAPLTLEESIFSTYTFSIQNKLSYQATSQLLQLMQLHFSKPNQYPPSLHALTKHFSTMTKLEITKFCLSCMAKIP